MLTYDYLLKYVINMLGGEGQDHEHNLNDIKTFITCYVYKCYKSNNNLIKKFNTWYF